MNSTKDIILTLLAPLFIALCNIVYALVFDKPLSLLIAIFSWCIMGTILVLQLIVYKSQLQKEMLMQILNNQTKLVTALAKRTNETDQTQDDQIRKLSTDVSNLASTMIIQERRRERNYDT